MSRLAAQEQLAARSQQQRSAALPVIRIRPRRGWAAIDLKELWDYRELLGFLTMRDIRVRYKQTVLGVLWAVIQPVMTMVVFTLLFSRYIKVSNLPYAVFTLCGILPWQLFANAMAQSSNSLVANQQLLTKIYFPRLIIPLSGLLSGILDFAISLLILVVMVLAYRIPLTAAVLTLPLFVAAALVTALAVGLWLSAMNVRYRDVRYVVPFLTQIWLFASAVINPSSHIPEKWRLLYGLNPMVGVVEGFRWALLRGQTDDVVAPGAMLAVSMGMMCVLLISGLYYFRRMERSFADVV
jgi:lipopolysaccharide transport system permease protein